LDDVKLLVVVGVHLCEDAQRRSHLFSSPKLHQNTSLDEFLYLIMLSEYFGIRLPNN
jgi:hypothetical protein